MNPDLMLQRMHSDYAFKAGNAVIFKGGSDAIHSNIKPLPTVFVIL